MSPSQRCDEIIRLIDELLCEHQPSAITPTIRSVSSSHVSAGTGTGSRTR